MVRVRFISFLIQITVYNVISQCFGLTKSDRWVQLAYVVVCGLLYLYTCSVYVVLTNLGILSLSCYFGCPLIVQCVFYLYTWILVSVITWILVGLVTCFSHSSIILFHARIWVSFPFCSSWDLRDWFVVCPESQYAVLLAVGIRWVCEWLFALLHKVDSWVNQHIPLCVSVFWGLHVLWSVVLVSWGQFCLIYLPAFSICGLCLGVRVLFVCNLWSFAIFVDAVLSTSSWCSL